MWILFMRTSFNIVLSYECSLSEIMAKHPTGLLELTDALAIKVVFCVYGFYVIFALLLISLWCFYNTIFRILQWRADISLTARVCWGVHLYTSTHTHTHARTHSLTHTHTLTVSDHWVCTIYIKFNRVDLTRWRGLNH